MQYPDWTSMHIGAINVGNFVIPLWYVLARGSATFAYYAAFRKYDMYSHEQDIKSEK